MAQSQTLQNSKTDLLSTKNIDFHGRQITNAADAVNNQDYVTLKQVNALVLSSKDVTSIIKQSIVKKFNGLSPDLPVRTDSAGNLTNGNTDLNTEVDGVLPIVNGGTASATAAAARTALSVAKLPQTINGSNFTSPGGSASASGSQSVTVTGSSFTAPAGGGACSGTFSFTINGSNFSVSIGPAACSGSQALI